MMPDQIDQAAVAAAIVRAMNPKAQAAFMATEWQRIPKHLRDEIAEGDARLEERRRRAR
jgi:hypothetical protein